MKTLGVIELLSTIPLSTYGIWKIKKKAQKEKNVNFRLSTELSSFSRVIHNLGTYSYCSERGNGGSMN